MRLFLQKGTMSAKSRRTARFPQSFFQHCIEILNDICREKKPNCASRGSRFAANFIQNLYTVLKKRLWESRSTPTLVYTIYILNVILASNICERLYKSFEF
jgi:hypothetical protein